MDEKKENETLLGLEKLDRLADAGPQNVEVQLFPNLRIMANPTTDPEHIIIALCDEDGRPKAAGKCDLAAINQFGNDLASIYNTCLVAAKKIIKVVN